MKTHNLLKVEMGDPNSIHGLPASYKMGHLGKPINHNQNGITDPLGTGQAQHKVHADIEPQSVRNW